MLVGYISRKLSDRVERGLPLAVGLRKNLPLWNEARYVLAGMEIVMDKDDLYKTRKGLELYAAKHRTLKKD
jgi:hypothetical protein